MGPYKEMYTLLFNAVTDMVAVLQKAQQACEALYMEYGEEGQPPRVVELPPPGKE